MRASSSLSERARAGIGCAKELWDDYRGENVADVIRLTLILEIFNLESFRIPFFACGGVENCAGFGAVGGFVSEAIGG